MKRGRFHKFLLEFDLSGRQHISKKTDTLKKEIKC